MSGERKEYTIEHHKALVDAFSEVKDNKKANESRELADIVSKNKEWVISETILAFGTNSHRCLIRLK